MGALLILLLLPPLPSSAETKGKPESPNILIMMADDLGFSDLGCYGGEISTPHLDRLAAEGVKFSQFYNTAKCHSSRVSLLTGQYCLAAGNTSMSHAVTTAEVLAQNGYFTAMTGKWHLQQQPTDFGFERYFGHLSGACNYFTGDQTFRLNGEPWTVPSENFYTTVANVDYALDFLQDARAANQPWYLYVAFNAPHAPLHALPEDYKKYEGRYEEGWDVTRAARFKNQQETGLFDKNLQASPRPNHVPAWNQLAPWQQTYESKRMSTLAAMIDRMDQEIGQLLENLEANGELENTFILFVSDNGACPYDRKAPILDTTPTNGEESFGDSTGWAWARNTPFRYYKQNQYEGGITTPAIIHWPKGIAQPKGSIIREAAHLIDVLPTVAQVTGSEIPNQWRGRELRTISGQSLQPLLQDEPFQRKGPIHFLFSTDRGLRDQKWKIVSFREEPWELYDLSSDRSELNNLAEQHPNRLNAMVQQWTQMTKETLHASARTYSPVRSNASEHQHPQWTRFERDTPISPSSGNPRLKTKSVRNSTGIRARKNTKMTISGSKLDLKFTGEDPGIAMDLRSNKLPDGPYEIHFRLQQKGKNQGEVFYTSDPKTTLPNGTRVEFEIRESEDWQSITVPVNTEQKIYQLRVDFSDGEGEASVDGIQLTDQTGRLLMKWPR